MVRSSLVFHERDTNPEPVSLFSISINNNNFHFENVHKAT